MPKNSSKMSLGMATKMKKSKKAGKKFGKSPMPNMKGY